MLLAQLIKLGSLEYVNGKTAKAKALRERWAYRDGGYYLSDVYGHYSGSKERAWEYCRELEFTLEGWGGCIVSHNITQFTYGFIVEDDNGIEYIVIVTKCHNYITERRL